MGPVQYVVLPSQDHDAVAATLRSLIGQADPKWSAMVVAGDGDPVTDKAAALSFADGRIEMLGVSDSEATLDEAVSRSEADLIGLLNPGTMVSSVATSWIRSLPPGTDVVFADHIADRQPVFKPAWSPDAAMHPGFVGPMLVVRPTVLTAVGGLGHGIDDVAARLAARPLVAAHMPNLLSTAPRRSTEGYPEIHPVTAAPATATTRRTLTVKVVIPTRDRVDLLRTAVDGVLGGRSRADVSLVIVDNGSIEDATLSFLDEVGRDARVSVERADVPFNFSRLCNMGAATGPHADVIVFMNNDIVATEPGWLDRLTEPIGKNGIAVVGPILLFDDGRVQHAGVVVGRDQFGVEPSDEYQPLAAHLAHGLWPEALDATVFGLTRDVTALTAACLAVDTQVFLAVGGFDEQLAVDFQDVDLCLRIGASGRRLILAGDVRLVHLESASRGSVGASAPQTLRIMAERWGERLADGDSAYSPHLNLDLTLAPVRDLHRDDITGRLRPRLTRVASW
jgi:GT2 family glycosyltransferase